VFTKEESDLASDNWGFNCGPGALCAMMGLTPNEIRPNLFEFERKKYTNPKLMKKIIRNCGWDFYQTYRGDHKQSSFYAKYGLARIQWDGPWTAPDVSMRKRQRYTHWIGRKQYQVFDINAMNIGGWLPFEEWENELVPWLVDQVDSRCNGNWWPTHVLEIYSTLDA
jgi:hypothetical protein